MEDELPAAGPGRNSMMIDTILFYFFATLAVVSAMLMVTRRNAVHSAVFLITTLLATAGIFCNCRRSFCSWCRLFCTSAGSWCCLSS